MPLDKKRSLPTLLGRVNKTPLTSVVSAVTAEGQSFEKTFPITTATASLEGTATAVSIMSQETTYFLVPASGGLCIRPQNNSVYTCNVEGKEDQQWTAEKGEGDKIAFRNATGKQYLRAKSGNNSGQVVLGQRQWWKLENSKTPGAFWIKNEDFPKSYLCNSYGRVTPNNLIYMWAPEPYWTQTMLWYIRDVESWKSQNGSSPDLAFAEGSTNPASAKASQEKEAELLEWQKRNEARQAAQDEKEMSLDAQERDQKKTQQEHDAQAKALEAKHKELEQRENAISAREEKPEKKETDASSKSSTDGESLYPRIAQLQQQLSDVQAALAQSQTKERQANERERKASEVYERLRQSKSGPAAVTDEEPHRTHTDDSVVAHRLRPLFDRADGDTFGALRDGKISGHGLQPLFERTRPTPSIALRDGSISAHRLQPFFERPVCGHCRMSHVVGEP
ncbi:hypothetical protein CLAFUW4_14238 [Fulvia fulva]|uniref:Uncharacterized protein n=1 Tax=Passalora fulva TaxID=5499 RepID=A0A9Q8PMC1_PASFU|nr:uncharacterized protein CLAFUR5_14071 [Fulvia fulva]UJO25259.1 hypothetical protein CLAFUR5_14071 [Fulvia fulva]WPV22715.1 hypothetical protein CLAFUW4_14238 [Fulvia fulva]